MYVHTCIDCSTCCVPDTERGRECCSEVRVTLVTSREKEGWNGIETLSDQTSYEESKSLAFILRLRERPAMRERDLVLSLSPGASRN